MKSIIMHQILNFIYNHNIDIVDEIYTAKVPETMRLHLIDKKNECQQLYDDNTKAWLNFIGNLDAENSEILFDFITTKK